MSVWFDKRLKCYRFQFENLKKYHTGTGFKTKREATAAREVKRKEVIKKPVPVPTVITFEDFASQYLDYAQRKFAPKVSKYKAYIYALFRQSLGCDPPVDQITSKDISQYLATRPSNNDYNNHRKDLCALWSWGKKTLQFPWPNPVLNIDRMPHTPAYKIIPTNEEIFKLILAATPGDEQDIILVCLHTLGRIDEVLRCAWPDVNLEKRVVSLWTKKRKNGAYERDDLPMNDDLAAVLYTRWEERVQDRWVFYNEETGTRYLQRPKLMASVCRRAGIPPIGMGRRKLSPREIKAFTKKNKRPPKNDELYVDFPHFYGFHALRHYMASYLADEEKISLKAVSGMLRHKRLSTTEIYIHSIDESLRAATTQITGKFAKPRTVTAHTKKEEATDIP